MSLLFRRFVASNLSDRIVQALQERQHVRPHATVSEALDAAAAATGFCTSASDQALAALRLNGSDKIGRLTGCQLSQLGRAIYRIWRPRTGPASAASGSSPSDEPSAELSPELSAEPRDGASHRDNQPA